MPFQAYLFSYTNPSNPLGFSCGGSLIDPFWVLTAGHCLAEANKTNVHLGGNNINEMVYQSTSHQLFVHPAFNKDTLENDVALVKLPRKAQGPLISVVRMAPRNLKDMSKRIFTASGFGTTEREEMSERLLKTDLRPLSNRECHRTMTGKSLIKVTRNTFCASAAADDSSGICSGDSGGPLTTKIGGETILIGISSWSNGKGCWASVKSGFVRVANYQRWIRDVMTVNS